MANDRIVEPSPVGGGVHHISGRKPMKPANNSSGGGRLKLIHLGALIVWVCFSQMPSIAGAQSSEVSKGVLVLDWYTKDHPWNVKFDQSFRTSLQSVSAGVFEYYFEYLESNRFPGEKQSRILRDFLLQKYAGDRIDVLVVNSDASLDFLLKYRKSLFPNIPIVFIAARHPKTEELSNKPGLTGIININTYKKTLDLALELHPATEQVFVISGTTQGDKKFETLAREELRGYESRIQFTYLTDLTPDELVLKMKSLPMRSIVFYVWQQSRNGVGKIIETGDIFNLIAPSTSVPIYGMTARNVGFGLLGGYVTSPETIGSKAAEMVFRIAQGAQAQNIAIENAPTTPMFDWRELRRWGIDEKTLPPGSIIRFKELSYWEQHKQYILGALAVFVVQSLFIAYLILERARRQRVSKGLRESEERFSKAFHSSPQPMTITSLEDGKYLDVNDRFLELSGYSREEVIGHSSIELNFWEGMAARAELVDPLKNGRSVRNLESRFRSKNGRIRYFLSSADLIELNGQLRVLVAASDITERKQAEEELNLLNAELEKRVADRTDELDAKARELESFAYSVAHDLKAPLRGIEGYSRLLLEDHMDALGEEGRDFLRAIRGSTERMNLLIDDLLAYSRIERRAFSAEPIEIRPLVENLIKERRIEFEERKIIFTMEVNGSVVIADTAGLSQALRNYLDNAIKFTSETRDPRIEVGADETEKSCRLWVRDNGVGFDMKFHDRIFEIFHRLHPMENYPGTGIGLAIVRKAIERMGGRVWAESEPGKGATFYLEVRK